MDLSRVAVPFTNRNFSAAGVHVSLAAFPLAYETIGGGLSQRFELLT